MARVALVIRHLPIAHLGNLEPVLLANDYEVHYVDVTSEELPAEAAEAPLVVVLGGDMGVYEKDAHPFIARELAFLERRLGSERATLGICLGAQMMAEALGETVRKGKTVEIGFREVRPTDAGLDSPLRHVAGVPMMQWHGDTFALPSGATRLASSAEYSNEAWSLGDRALAVQFHPELTGAMYEEWIVDGLPELERHGIDPDDLRAQAALHGAAMEQASIAMFGEWLALQP
ncbi:glutamine amidotransferase [Lacisediminihabitans profunda]|uniref:Glutamine amidotransferase n=1 Tax=Lacisediminihabitans profunda TaxID=2594790 RepID=A0A5C8UXB0_9MICO|nr:glutamine amidotransferase [Lacisediminihabitans profunda]TXN32349.1 glutamine amidotransferase [Lacisediminihabitans profunda]